MDREKVVEAWLRKKVMERGGLCLKLVCPGFAGVPDRMLLLPGGRIAFVETKAPGKKERPRQRMVQGAFRRLGCTVFESVDSMERARAVLEWCEGKTEKAKEQEQKI